MDLTSAPLVVLSPVVHECIISADCRIRTCSDNQPEGRLSCGPITCQSTTDANHSGPCMNEALGKFTLDALEIPPTRDSVVLG
jgi:hypothetical protein